MVEDTSEERLSWRLVEDTSGKRVEGAFERTECHTCAVSRDRRAEIVEQRG